MCLLFATIVIPHGTVAVDVDVARDVSRRNPCNRDVKQVPVGIVCNGVFQVRALALREEVLYVIFLDLNKAYDNLERSSCLDILEGYGVGPRACRIIQTYCRRMTMVAKAGGYYGKAFKGDREVTQGDLLSPTILNVVVDAVVKH